jgi:hypothetical protein
MAVTVAKDMLKAERLSHDSPFGILSGTVTFDASYASGGESVTDITKYFTTCDRVICDSPLGYLVEWVKTTKLLKVYATIDTVAGTRVEAAGDLSTVVVSFIAIGRV